MALPRRGLLRDQLPQNPNRSSTAHTSVLYLSLSNDDQRYRDAMKLWLSRLRMQLAVALLICSCAAIGHAQSPKNNSLPKVGTIKDYPATGLMTGCGNLYFHQRGKSNATDADYVFLARGDGSNAWMNLDGRDVRLRQIKIARSEKQKSHRILYHYGNWQITVTFAELADESTANPDGMFEMKITLRKARAVRVVHAVGSSDC